ncbi:hypothetical protein [Endozoicomonas sp. Mp262]|uniref:hypothetical protein n=1 Tax=Endozoicomonas sp. Mp262 TaxID=2919499 RepID=UPI0021DA1EEF
MALTTRQQKRKVWLEDMLDAIDARISGDITSGASAMSYNGRNLQRYSLAELDTLRSKFENELTGLEAKEQGRSKYQPVRVRF